MIDKTKITDGMVIHCPTEENARELMQVLDELGYIWSHNIPLSADTYWDRYAEKTCYKIKPNWMIRYGLLRYFRNIKNEAVTEYSDLLCDTPPEADTDQPNPYWDNIQAIALRQRNKGIPKYGYGLENNTELTTHDTLTYLQEELIDGLMYCEHIKAKIEPRGLSDDIKRIAVHYGRQAQMVKCVEELNELAVALLHDDYPNIVEEIADVEVTITQVKYLLGIPDAAVSEIKQAKIERQLKRIREGLHDQRRATAVPLP